MMEQEREDFYDREIAPVLADLSKRCQDNGLSLVAVCEWSPEDWGRTRALSAGSSFAIRMLDSAAQAHGNVDSLIMALMRHATSHGHSSVCLKQLGIPLSPSHPKEGE